jgi:uncharacterized protein YcfJ
MRYRTLAVLAGALALSACAVVPQGPTYTAMPGRTKSFDQFQFDDAACRQYSTQAIGGTTPNEQATNAGVGSAVVGTAIGAAIGGLVGGHEGAAVGAGMGLFTGSAVGAGNAQAVGYNAQQRYDNAYYTCMYSHGHKVPMPAGYARSVRQASASVPPPPNAPPPYVSPVPSRGAAPASAPPPNAATPPPNAPPPNAAIPPPNAPPPYVQR